VSLLQAHRCLQTAVIEEEASQEHDAATAGSSAASQPARSRDLDAVATGQQQQHVLEHFVDNLMNEAAQQSKHELDDYLVTQHQQSDPRTHRFVALNILYTLLACQMTPKSTP